MCGVERQEYQIHHQFSSRAHRISPCEVDKGRLYTRNRLHAIVLVSLFQTTCPLLWTVIETQIFSEMRRSGMGECATAKISRIKAHLHNGGELRIGVGTEERRTTAAIQQGKADHKRTHEEGRIRPAKTTGEGDMELMGRINSDQQIYLSRTGGPHERLLTVQYYKFFPEMGEVAVAESGETGSMVQQMAEVCR